VLSTPATMHSSIKIIIRCIGYCPGFSIFADAILGRRRHEIEGRSRNSWHHSAIDANGGSIRRCSKRARQVRDKTGNFLWLDETS